MMPKMKGDEILKKEKNMVPDTQRLLISENTDLEILVSAVNNAGIQKCLMLPFQDDDLLRQVKYCCDQYETKKKLENLKRVTKRQNHQLYQIASNFKKKGDAYAVLEKQKEKEIRVLESRFKSAGGDLALEKEISIKNLLSKKKVPTSADGFSSFFLTLKDQLKYLIETAMSQQYISLEEISYNSIFDLTLSEKSNPELVQKILPIAMGYFNENDLSDSKTSTSKVINDVVLDDQFEMSLSKNRTKAYIKVKTRNTQDLDLAHVKQFLEKNKVINGLKKDKAIEAWLYNSTPKDNAFIIAQGKAPKYPKNAEIRYHFPTDFSHAGKVNDGGSMTFHDRGDIPYIEENAFLAAKIFAEEGSPGIDVHGAEIIVEEPEDLTFSSGSGTRISEDGVRIYATTAGQPHLDAMGNITVCPEYQIKGDIGFDTGDVTFDGNVVINGAVKQGFKVTCASLTAKEIQGAEVDIEGDLNISNGIVDTELVKVKGSVQAKFIHNSKINCFGDLNVQKEIIDSTIYLSGACNNENGIILNSQLSAKMGIKAGNIGNKSSKASTLTVGVDEHTNLLMAKVDSKLNTNSKAIDELSEEMAVLEKEDQGLHATISKHAFVQDRSQLELSDIEGKMENLKASGNMAAYQKVGLTVKKIRKDAEIAEEKINAGFDRQDEKSQEIKKKKSRIRQLDDERKGFLDEKKRLKEFSDRKQPLPEVKVGKKIESGTKIFSANSSLNIYNATSRCRIREYSRRPEGSGGAGGIEFYEMKVGEY